MLVLGALKDTVGPWPARHHARRRQVPPARFPVPITVVPGCLELEEILALA